MAVTSFWFGIPIRNIFNGVANANWDWDADTFKAALTTSTYVPDRDTHDFFNDVTNELPTAGGYTAGGDTLVTSTATYDTATDQVRIDSDDAQWTSSSFTARIAVVYKSTGVASTSPLIIAVDFGGDETVSSGTFTIQWDATGIGFADVS